MSLFKHNLVYKTTNLVNGKIYIGVHRTNDLEDGYLGSGKSIKRSIRYYGKDKFKREILFDYDNPNDMFNKEKELVTEEFVKRKDTYNLILGGDFNTTGTISVKDKDKNYFRVFKDDPRYLSGELVGVNIGMINVKDKDGNIFQVSKNDPRYLSGELVSNFKGTINVKDKNGNIFRISKYDPRYLSGELVPMWTGKKHSNEFKKKIGHINSEKQKGKGNSQYGTMWITNGKDNKKIKKTDVIPDGWNKGRKIIK
jgi:hypothetical protein